ncbi:MAG: UDP-N-acetylmuramate--L-alanine ligase, partial [bacterium]|nr:UDP-N-acetylmuramate--L-alanine ligase [bacterium]
MNRIKNLLGKTETVHFTGIGGSGMNGIAHILLNLGYKVQGSDLVPSEVTRRLKELGARIFTGHRAQNVWGADVLVYSSAVQTSNPEIREAVKLKIPMIPRAEMLAELMRIKRGIAIAGTHGKTTTSSLIGHVFQTAGRKPTTIIGGKVFNFGAHARLGTGEFLICEADESDGSFLKLSPESVVVTNIDNDHLDYYHTMKNLKSAFIHFINKVPFYGFTVLCLDDRNIRSILPEIRKKVITYGFHPGADFVITRLDEVTFRLRYNSRFLKEVRMNKPGIHNMLNTTAAIITGLEFGLSFIDIEAGISTYKGVERRMEVIGAVRGIRIMDDYGHHPTEIKATLNAVSLSKDFKRLIVV